MCGVIDDAFNFVKDSVGEVFHHPLQALGAAAGVPGYDPFFGGLFNNREGGALISPTGNFTSSAWNDMYNANPNDSGALGLFHGVNSIADKVAPAVAGYFAAPALGAALGGTAGDTAGIGADTFASGAAGAGAGGASTLGGMEAGMGGAALFGPAAGTGTAIGSSVAQGLGAGGLGVAGGDTLSGLTASSGAYTGGLGGSSGGTGLGSLPTGGAQLPSVPGNPSGVNVGGGAQSLEGGQQAAMPQVGNPAAAAGATGSPAPGSDLSALYGPTSTAAGSPMGSALGQSTAGVGGGVTPYGATLGQDLSQGNGLFGTGLQLNDIMNLAKVGQSAWQQFSNARNARNYAGSISNLFSPNSPYAQQMAQTLARQDAARGRNSQYGTRATELAAALTQAQANALGGNNYAQAAQNNAMPNILNGVFNAFGSPSGMASAQRIGSAAFNGLSSLFGG